MTTKPIERATRPPNASVREAPFALVRDPRVDGQPDDGATLDGWGAIFSSPTIIDSWEGRFVETIAPGSMAQSFRDSPPLVQYDHGRHPLIGSLPIAALLSATEDSHPTLAPRGGAHIVARIIDNWLFSPVREAIRAGAISGMSFRFEVLDEEWHYSDGRPIPSDRALIAELEKTWDDTVPDDELPVRTLKLLSVKEIGPVAFPAYTDTSVTVRQGTIDLDRLQEPEQRNLLARAIFTADSDARGVPDLDDGLRTIRGMLLDVAARRVRVAREPDVGLDEAAATIRAMVQDIEARKAWVARQPAGYDR
jgi:uncharacterized protein